METPPERPPRGQLKGYWAVILLCCGYCILAGFQLSLPGLEYDEVLFGPAALGQSKDFLAPATAEPAARFSPLSFNAFTVTIGSYSLPVMIMPYWGALRVHLQTAIFGTWGVSSWTIRGPSIALGAVTLMLFTLLCFRSFPPPVAVFASVLLATDPSYIFFTRHDFGGAALSLFLIVAPLWCLVWWWDRGGQSLLGVAFFLFGLGLYHRLDYLAFLAALSAAAIVVWLRVLRNYSLQQAFLVMRIGRRELTVACIGFLLGWSPYLYFAWQRPTIAASVQNFATPAADVVTVARVKGYVLWTVLNGASLYDFFAARSGVNVGRVVDEKGDTQVGSFALEKQVLPWASLFTGTLTPWIFLLFGCVVWFFHPPSFLKLLGAVLAVFLGCVWGVQGAIRGHHFVVFLPFVQTFCAISWGMLWERIHRRWSRIVLILFATVCVGLNLIMVWRYHHFLAYSGGRGVWTEATYDLTRYLQERCSRQRCLIGDWGLGTPVVTLSAGSFPVEEIFWSYLQEGNELALETSLRSESLLFVFYTDAYTNFSRPKRLIYEAARRVGLAPIVQKQFTERDGTPVIEVVSMGKPGEP